MHCKKKIVFQLFLFFRVWTEKTNGQVGTIEAESDE